MKKLVVIANWKMNIGSHKEAARFLSGLRRKMRYLRGTEAWIAAPSTLIPLLKNPSVKIGAQAVSAWNGGPHTGEVSAEMLKNSGAKFSIIGHSERREFEDDDAVRKQLSSVLSAGLTAVLCVGEKERSTDGSHFNYIEGQIKSACSDIKHTSRLVIAYEPVWAIGKSAQEAMRPAEVEEMAIFIRKTLSDILGRAAAAKIPILYGGSVEPINAREIIAEGGVKGLLVGHASADLNLFLEILKICRK